MLWCAMLLSSSRSPVPTITWRKINGNIPKKARLRKSQAVLEIPNIQLEDSGTYECKAENPRGSTAFKGHLQVYSESKYFYMFCLHWFREKMAHFDYVVLANTPPLPHTHTQTHTPLLCII